MAFNIHIIDTKWVFDKIIQFSENNAFKRTRGDDDFDSDYINDDIHEDCEYDDDDEGLEISIS